MRGFGYASKRVFDALITILLVMVLGFFLLYWGRLWVDTSSISALPVAFASYAGLVFLDGFGISVRYGIPVLQLVGEHATYTILLLGTAVVASVLVGTLAGLMSAWKRDSLTDRSLTLALLIPFAIPSVWLVVTFLYWFSYRYRLFPLSGSFSEQWLFNLNWSSSSIIDSLFLVLELGALVFGLAILLAKAFRVNRETRWKAVSKPAIYAIAVITWTYLIIAFVPFAPVQFALDVLWHLFIPCTTLILSMLYLFFLTARNSSIAVLSESYILTARAKGLPSPTILLKHAFRNSMLPTIALLAQSMTIILGLELIVEIIFTWNGLGMLIYLSVNLGYLEPVDYPVLIGVLFILSAIVTLGNALSDIMAHHLDPTLRRVRESEIL